LKRFNFDVQFCWQPMTPSQRQEAREKGDGTKAEEENSR
jgi:hypothetical protein